MLNRVIDKPYVESRVDNWKLRINKLYSLVKNTLEKVDGIEYEVTKKVTMYEELMNKFNIAPTEIPILDLYYQKKLIASFQPIGLWVIGANGRIDILTKTGAFILVNVAKNEHEIKWEVFTPTNRKKAQVFDTDFIRELIALK